MTDYQQHDDQPIAKASSSSASAHQPIYGNFRRYYHIRNPLSTDPFPKAASPLDPRLPFIVKYLQSHLQAAEPIYRILDIGCNSGKLTIELAQILASVGDSHRLQVVGVDIDPDLIQEAKEAANLAWSQCRPITQYFAGQDQRSSKHQNHPQNHDDQDGLDLALPPESRYFPAEFARLFGPLPPPTPELAFPFDGSSSQTGKKRKRRHVVDHRNLPFSLRAFQGLEFICAEWACADLPIKLLKRRHRTTTTLVPPDAVNLNRIKLHDQKAYHVVLALSLTKWIHIHQGDLGLLRFFARISQTLLPGGSLILERQPWKSYEHARKMGLQDKLKMLRFRPDDIDWLLDLVGLESGGQIGQGVGMGFTRSLDVFIKPKHPYPLSKQRKETIEALLKQTQDEISWVPRQVVRRIRNKKQNGSCPPENMQQHDQQDGTVLLLTKTAPVSPS